MTTKKANPDELAMHKAAEKDVDAELEKQLQTPTVAVVETAEETTFTQEPPKRKRGRPSNAEKALEDVLQKENVGDDSVKPGVTNKPSRKSGGSKSGIMDPVALGEQLVGLHALAAMFTQIPEFQIKPEEGANLAAAVVAVCQEYNLSLSGKTGAGIQLMAAAAMIYVPRVLHFKSRISQAQQNEAAVNVQQPTGFPASS